MFTIKTRQDVLDVAKTFGLAALKHIIEKDTIMDAGRVINECFQWAANEVISIDSFNDGNTVWELDACFNANQVAGFYCTGIDDITIIRSGIGNFSLPLRDAIERKEISTEQASKVIAEITARNQAAEILYP